MVNVSIPRLPIEGVMFLVSNDGCESSFPFACQSVDDARQECRWWLFQRPDLRFVSVVVGAVLVASAGSFPFGDFRVSLAPLGC